MKQELKYLRLFEAFESIKLSKTLKFLNKDGKSKFLSSLKNIATAIDFPISKFSDEYFQYLPFKKALDLNFSYEDKPCDATSGQAFPDFAVAGAVCDSGMVDRKWGRSVRKAKCPICNGTGVKKKESFDIKWVKFWFDKDGNFVNVTGTDGQIRDQYQSTNMKALSISQEALAPGDISRNYSDYDVVKELTNSELLTLPTGAIIKIRLEGRDTIAVVWRSTNGGFFAIQNTHSGSSDDYSTDWRRYGRNSWVITGRTEYTGTPQLLVPKGVKVEVSDDDDLDDKIDPYTWNAPLVARHGGIVLGKDPNMSKFLTNAHFAIVLNFLDLKNSGFIQTKDTKKEREESRKGALALMSDESVKQQNLRRYIDEISNRLNIPSEIGDLNKTINRFMGGYYAGLYVLRGRNMGELQSFISYLYSFLTSELDKEYNYSQALEYFKRVVDNNIRFNSDVTTSIKEMRSELKTRDREELIPVLDAILDLNQAITDKFKKIDIETLEDIEIIFEKIKAIRNVYRDSDRLKVRECYYITEHFSNSSRTLSYLTDITDVEKTLVKIQKLKKFIERL
jgi:hypothetical protein